VPDEILGTPVDAELLSPVPPYCAPIAVPFQVPELMVPPETFRPLTAVALRLPPLRVPPEMVPPEIVAPLMVELQASAPVALVSVQPVRPEPPPSSMLPVEVAPIWTRPVVPASTVKLVAAAELIARVPDDVRLGVVTEVAKLGLATTFIVNVLFAPPSTAERFVPAVKTLSAVNVPFELSVIYSAALGAPPPEPPTQFPAVVQIS
jgi:hypothetical protein